ncbi:MAG: hypothetical protein L0Y57_12265 [Beijerinckiaceae bacterium]|nr:hypothetical protein [Beijerinckiaceae bacterium]
MNTTREIQGADLTPRAQKARRRRSIAMAIALGCAALLLYALTIAKLGPGVLSRPL